MITRQPNRHNDGERGDARLDGSISLSCFNLEGRCVVFTQCSAVVAARHRFLHLEMILFLSYLCWNIWCFYSWPSQRAQPLQLSLGTAAHRVSRSVRSWSPFMRRRCCRGLSVCLQLSFLALSYDAGAGEQRGGMDRWPRVPVPAEGLPGGCGQHRWHHSSTGTPPATTVPVGGGLSPGTVPQFTWIIFFFFPFLVLKKVN